MLHEHDAMICNVLTRATQSPLSRPSRLLRISSYSSTCREKHSALSRISPQQHHPRTSEEGGDLRGFRLGPLLFRRKGDG